MKMTAIRNIHNIHNMPLRSVILCLLFFVAQAQLVVPPIAPSNLRGKWKNSDRESRYTILSITFDEYDCIITKGMHCTGPDAKQTQADFIAPTTILGECYYNNHTNNLYILTPSRNYTFTIYFTNDGNVLTLINDQTNVDNVCNKPAIDILATNETVHLTSEANNASSSVA